MKDGLEASLPAASGYYLRLSVTSACDLRCRYCRPGPPSPRRRTAPPPGDDEIVALAAAVAQAAPVRKVRLTGGEPLLRPGIARIVRGLRQRLPGAVLAMTTNGQRLAPLAAELRRAGLDAVNVSLDTLDPMRFARVTPAGRLEATLAGIDAAARVGFSPLKINTVLMRSVNASELDRLVRFAADRGAEIRFIELMPIGAGAPLFRREFLSAGEARRRLASAFEDRGPLGRSGTAGRWLFRVGGRDVAVGFISPVSAPFCDGCDRLRLDSQGRLLRCLRGEDGIDLLEPLRRGDTAAISEIVRDVLALKDRPATSWPRRTMIAVGG
ncbi:MAG: radical SAM protein [Acidobacteria bacterium]|nr:MAG: radical SAM protein [Acidobacteriota bacterium]